MELGRVFRKLGLPAWTFIGIGISAIWFNYFGALVEKLAREGFGINESTKGWRAFLPPLIVFSLPFIVVIGVWIWQRSHRVLSKLTRDGEALSRPEGKKGLILLISNIDSAMFAIEYHFREKATLESVWLLPSNDVAADEFGSGTRHIAEKIKERCEQVAAEAGRSLVVEIHPTGVSPADSQDTFDYVNRVFRQRRYEQTELIADFTGGTKPMSVGMIMACLPAQRELEYVPYNRDTGSHGPFLVDYQHRAFDLIG